MITSIYFENFKAFESYTISLKDFNILTGPNNNGKSTILDSLRLLRGAYAYASRLNPTFYNLPDGKSGFGYSIPEASLPIVLGNIQTNLNDGFSKIRYRLKDGQNLYLLFSPEHPTYLYFDTPRKPPQNSSSFKKEFPLKISIIPTLGPLEVEEERLNEDYVKQWGASRRAPRMFRNYWYYNPDDFEPFKQLVEETWPGMSIKFPEKEQFSKRLMMFCLENRITREICWAGSGFQIWIQLLTHIIKSKNSDIIVVDEPEIYLHPDLQHKIFDLLKSVDSKIVLATHSIEIINNAEPSDILLVDKKLQSAKRLTDMAGLQSVSNLLGSGQNIQLTRLARGKRILFVEGQDAKLLAKFAKIIGRDDLLTSGEITIISIEGFSQHERILSANWAFSQILGEEMKIFALFDRDYRTQEEIDELINRFENEIDFVHVLKKKEIENYLLVPEAIQKAINARMFEREKNGDEVNERIDARTILVDLSDKLRSQVQSQLSANKIKLEQKGRVDIATILSKFNTEFDEKWQNLEYRLSVIPGKLFLSDLNQYLQKVHKISITPTQIINNSSNQIIDNDLHVFFDNLQEFKNK